MKKLLLVSFVASVGCSLFADIEAGTYENMNISDTKFASPAGSASWVFDGTVFENPFSLEWQADSADSEYLVKYGSTSATFTKFLISRDGANSSTVFEMQGTSDKRAVLSENTFSDSSWNMAVESSKNYNSNSTNELRLLGYSDFSVSHFKIASDAGYNSGNAGVVISGAGNTFTSEYNCYINTAAANADSTNRLYFNISGVEGAKSVANFKKDFNVRAAGSGLTEINMRGNAEMTVDGTFAFGSDDTISTGKAVFTISGQNNALITTKTGGNYFLLASDAKGGDISFKIAGKNNTLSVANTTAWIGSAKTGNANVVFEIEGSGHSINFGGNLNFRAQNGNSVKLGFIADESGLSTLNAGGLTLFDGILSIDMENFAGDESGVYEATLISANNNWSGLASSLISSSDNASEKVNVIMGDSGVSWNLSYSDGDLVFVYNYTPEIPEPSTCAAVFGALALVFAAYRRRK